MNTPRKSHIWKEWIRKTKPCLCIRIKKAMLVLGAWVVLKVQQTIGKTRAPNIAAICISPGQYGNVGSRKNLGSTPNVDLPAGAIKSLPSKLAGSEKDGTGKKECKTGCHLARDSSQPQIHSLATTNTAASACADKDTQRIVACRNSDHRNMTYKLQSQRVPTARQQ